MRRQPLAAGYATHTGVLGLRAHLTMRPHWCCSLVLARERTSLNTRALRRSGSCRFQRPHRLTNVTLEIRPSMKAWGEKAKAGVWPARASLHLGITLRSLNGGIPTLQFKGASNLTQAFLMDVFVSRTGPKKNASSDAKTKYFHRACRTGPTKNECFDAKTRYVILALASYFPYGFRHYDCSLFFCFILRLT